MATAKDVHGAIALIVDKQRASAQQSAYDWKVCVLAVSAAHEVFRDVPVQGSAAEYCDAVLATLVALQDRYSDSDGEFTNGSSEIGTIAARVKSLRDSL